MALLPSASLASLTILHSSIMEKVSHKGKIVDINPQYTTVEIVAESACSACHAAGLCGMSEIEKKAIEVPSKGWDNYQIGQEVNVVLRASMGHKAVWLAYVAPLVVLVAVLLGLVAVGVNELVAGLAGLGAVAVYYFGIWLFRDRLRNEYIFTIEN